MPQFVIHHHHQAHDCGVVYAAFRGFDSPLRRQPTAASCPIGGHEVWWWTTAPDREGALAQLPPYVAASSTVTRVEQVDIP